MANGLIIGAVVTLVLGFVLLPVITSSAAEAETDPNASAQVQKIAQLGPLFYIMLVVFGSGALVYFGAKNR